MASMKESNRLFAIGGFDGLQATSRVEVLEFETERVIDGPELRQSRWGCASLWIDASRAIVVGGCNGIDYEKSTEVLEGQFEEELEPGDDLPLKVYDGPSMETERAGCTIVRMWDDHHFLVVGGYGLETTEVLDTSDAKNLHFVRGPRLLTKRSCCAAVYLGKQLNQLLVIGGYAGAGGLPTNTTEILNMTVNFEEDEGVLHMKFKHGPSMKSCRGGCAATLISDQRLLVCGGFDGGQRLNTTEVLDIESMTWSPGPEMRLCRSGCFVVPIDKGRLLVGGGYDGESYHHITETLDNEPSLEDMAFNEYLHLDSKLAHRAAVAK